MIRLNQYDKDRIINASPEERLRTTINIIYKITQKVYTRNDFLEKHLMIHQTRNLLKERLLQSILRELHISYAEQELDSDTEIYTEKLLKEVSFYAKQNPILRINTSKERNLINKAIKKYKFYNPDITINEMKSFNNGWRSCFNTMRDLIKDRETIENLKS